MNVSCSSEIYSIPAAGGVTVTLTGTAKLISVVMTLAIEVNNTFCITLVREGITFELLSHEGTYKDVVWLLEGGGVVLKSGDQLRFSNLANEEGYVFFGYETNGPQGPSITVTPGPVVDDAAGPLA